MVNAPRTSWTQGLALLSVICLLVSVAVLHQSATAQPGGKAAAPTAVAVVDINRILEQSSEAAALLTKLQASNERRKAELEKLNEEINTLVQKIELAPRGSAERQRLEGEYLVKNAQGETQVKVLERIGDLEAGPELWALYVKINSVISDIASQRGYDLVLSDDSRLPTIPEGKQFTSTAVRNTTNNRQILFKSPRIDITEHVITMMNNEFQTRAGRR